MEGTRYCQPYFLEDKTGSLAGSEFVDLNDRMKLVWRRTRADGQGTQYYIYDLTSGRPDAETKPVVILDFGPNSSLGLINYGSSYIKMENYLQKVTPSGSLFYTGDTKTRAFTSRDGRRFRWSYRTHEDQEWTCVDSSERVVASYHLKVPGEPHYPGSSGCMLTIEEAYGDLAVEFLATCMIMRHILTLSGVLSSIALSRRGEPSS